MPRGEMLTEAEKKKIRYCKGLGLSNRKIGQKIGRSHSVVCNFLRLGDRYCSIKRPGAVPKVSETAKDKIKLLSESENISSTEIAEVLSLPVSSRRIRQILEYAKKEKPIVLKEQYAENEEEISLDEECRYTLAKTNQSEMWLEIGAASIRNLEKTSAEAITSDGTYETVENLIELSEDEISFWSE